jgi:hypothetical protein
MHKGNELLALQALADIADDDGVAWPSIPYWAKKARVSRRTLQRILTKLVRSGELLVETGAGVMGTKGGPQRTHLYRVVTGLEGSARTTPPSMFRVQGRVTRGKGRVKPGRKGGGAGDALPVIRNYTSTDTPSFTGGRFTDDPFVEQYLNRLMPKISASAQECAYFARVFENIPQGAVVNATEEMERAISSGRVKDKVAYFNAVLSRHAALHAPQLEEAAIG